MLICGPRQIGSQQGIFTMFSIGKLAVAAIALGITAASAHAQVVVSSKIDTEGGVLGNIIQLVLNANNIKTTDRIQLGATPVVRKAITAGEIDIYPEYTGNAAFFFQKADDPVWKDAAKAYETAKKLDYDANKIVWLSPSPANNTWAIALRKEVADENKLTTLSDFGKYVSGGGKVVLAASAEFVNSAAALPAFQTTYGFKLKPDQLITLSGGDHRRGRQPDQRRQRRDGLRHRRRHPAFRPGRAPGRQECAARLPAGADHPREGVEGTSENRVAAEAGFRQARSRHTAATQRPRSTGR